MAFNPQQTITKIPTEISTIEINLWVTTDKHDPRAPKGAEYKIHIDDQNGRTMNYVSGDLVPHLTPAQVQWLLKFMDDIKAQAEAQVLP